MKNSRCITEKRRRTWQKRKKKKPRPASHRRVAVYKKTGERLLYTHTAPYRLISPRCCRGLNWSPQQRKSRQQKERKKKHSGRCITLSIFQPFSLHARLWGRPSVPLFFFQSKQLTRWLWQLFAIDTNFSFHFYSTTTSTSRLTSRSWKNLAIQWSAEKKFDAGPKSISKRVFSSSSALVVVVSFA